MFLFGGRSNWSMMMHWGWQPKLQLLTRHPKPATPSAFRGAPATPAAMRCGACDWPLVTCLTPSEVPLSKASCVPVGSTNSSRQISAWEVDRKLVANSSGSYQKPDPIPFCQPPDLFKSTASGLAMKLLVKTKGKTRRPVSCGDVHAECFEYL